MSKDYQYIRSFGRIKSRKLSSNKENLYKQSLKKYEIDIDNLNFLNDKENYLEIGFGHGDFTYSLAQNNKSANIIACETYINGIINLVKKIEDYNLKNISIFKSDIRELLNILPDNILNEVYILFPDPWPKAKHRKRRLINCDLLSLLYGKMVKSSNSKLVIATDDNSYKEWIMHLIVNSKYFAWSAKKKGDWQNFPDNWTYTKYQKKAEKFNRDCIYLELFTL